MSFLKKSLLFVVLPLKKNLISYWTNQTKLIPAFWTLWDDLGSENPMTPWDISIQT